MNQKDLRETLKNAGFIRVDGLKILKASRCDFMKKSGIIEATIPKGIGGRIRMGNNNGFTAIETPDGEIWLGKPSTAQIDQLVGELCHMDITPAVNVPCSEEGCLDFNDLMSRNSNPDYIPPYCKQ